MQKVKTCLCGVKDGLCGVKDWHLMDRIRSSEKRGIVIGMLIALGVITLVTIAVVKYLWLKKQFDGLCYDLDDLYDDEDFEEGDECCEEGCCADEEKKAEENE
jgi:hypothetical protein